MNKERELLERALEAIEYAYKGHRVSEEIRTYLSTSDDAEEPMEFKFIPTGKELLRYHPDEDCIETKVEFANYPAGSKFYPPKPAEQEAEYDFYGVIPLTHRKAKGIIKDRGYHVTGFVLSRPDGDKCIIDMSAVRWLTGKEFFEMMHPPVFSPTAEPEAKPVLYIKEQELLYIQVLKQEGLAQEWKSNLGLVKEAGDVGLYLHPPKSAEPARKPINADL